MKKVMVLSSMGIALAALAYLFMRGSHVDENAPPVNMILGSYQRTDSLKVDYIACTMTMGVACPAYDFTSRERDKISLALDQISTDVLQRSGIRRIVPVSGGADHV